MTTYRSSGVDLEAAERAVDRISDDVTATWGDEVVGGFGGFAAGIRLPAGYTRPVLMMSTDGVGTKADLARRAGRLDGLGFDLVAMCIDDLAAAGARPLAMTDYLAVGELDVDVVSTLVRSVAAACAAAGVALLGGETAEHPGVMPAGDFDLAGAALGVVEEGRQVDGSAVVPGDVVVGVASPNLRSNGFSLVRAVLAGGPALDDPLPGCGGTVAEVVLAPSVIYAPAIVDLVTAVEVHGMAHVTGGGLPGNVPRILPAGCDAFIETGSWESPPVFAAIQRLGGVPDEEMYSTFNMGIGFVVVLPPEAVMPAVALLAGRGHHASVIGAVTPGSSQAHLLT